MKTGSAALVCGSTFVLSRALLAKTINLPLGLQLYSVRDLLPKDYQGTLKLVGDLGFREVESAGYFHHSAAEVKQAMESAKLKLVSAHYPLDSLRKQLDEILAFSKDVGVGHVVCS